VSHTPADDSAMTKPIKEPDTDEDVSEQDLVGFVQLLAEQMAELLDRISRLEARMNAAQPEAPAPVMSYGEFLTAARDACRKIDQKGRTFGLIPIPDLRQTLGERLSRNAFDQYVLQLQRDRLVYLMPHDHPSSLREERRRDCVVHPTGGLMYFLRWRESESEIDEPDVMPREAL
jgi:hypothetical protein